MQPWQPLHNNCGKTESPSSMPDCHTLSLSVHENDEEENTRFIDMGTFYVSFAASYIIVLLGIVAVLYKNPYWPKSWFYLVEMCISLQATGLCVAECKLCHGFESSNVTMHLFFVHRFTCGIRNCIKLFSASVKLFSTLKKKRRRNFSLQKHVC